MQFLTMSAIATGMVGASSPSYAQPVHLQTPNYGTPQGGMEVTHMVEKPKLPIELAINLKYIFDHDLLLRNDFYTRESLQNFFNVVDVSVINEKDNISIATNDFSNIFPQKSIPGPLFDSTPRAQLTGGKISPNSSASVIAAINFSMNLGGPNFEQTNRIFGGNLHRLTPIPFPHVGPPPPTAPHGNESWMYQQSNGATSKSIGLGFNPAGELSNVVISYEKCPTG
jgi:hypothetical protein